MSDRHKRRHDSEDEEDFVGFDDSDDGHESQDAFNSKRIRKGLSTSVKEEETSLVYDMQSEEEFISLYQNWETVDKSLFPNPGPLGIPFEFGWKRELVFRAQTGVSKEKGDVYYITPMGRKLRTRNEIQANLTQGLTMDNFSLSKVPLYLGPEFEIVRSAKMKTSVKMPSPREISPLLGKRIPKPKAPKGASPTPMSGSPSSAAGTPVRRVVQGGSNAGARSNVGNPNATYTSKAHTPLSIVSKTIMSTVTGSSGSGRAPANPTTKRIIHVQAQAPAQQQQTKMNPCTIQCRLAQGIPQLQCVSCLCLYHKECVMERRGPSHNTIGQNYVCDGCCPAPPASTQPNTSNPNNNTTTTPVKDSSGGTNTGRQSVVTINGQRFIVVPKTKAATPNTGTGSATTPQVVSRAAPQQVKMITIATKSAINNGNNKQQQSRAVVQPRPFNAASNFFRTTAMGYDVLLNVFQCLTVKELLRASRVCRLFNYTAMHPFLWRTVRMKNSLVIDWSGFARALRSNGTRHLDMRKMLLSGAGNTVDDQWEAFVTTIGRVEQLQGIDLCGRCPPGVVESLYTSNRQLRVLNGQALREQEEGLNFTDIECLSELEELRLRPEAWMSIRGDLEPLSALQNLRHLSLTFFLGLTEEDKHITALASLQQLETLEIGECTHMITELAEQVLPNLTLLRRLRLEKGSADAVLMTQLASMSTLEHLELVNFDIKAEFNETLAQCTNIRKLMVIPTYLTQSATTNHLIMSGLLSLGESLQVFTWVVTQELLRVTELYRMQDETIELIPIIKPVPGDDVEEDTDKNDAMPEVEMVPLMRVQEILNTHLPETYVTILKEDLQRTWRLNIVDP